MAFRSNVLDRKYHFEYDVGLWAFGAIQVIKDRKTEALRMCKTVRKELVRGADVMPRLQRLCELQHTHICAITDLLEDQARIYIVYDKCQGGDLAEWLTRVQEEGNWLQEHIIAEYIRQTLIALAHGHGSRAFHRDLRPSSLFLSSKLPDAKVLVTDMGLSDILDPKDEVINANPSPYTAPEVGSGQGQVQDGAAADMWSVGAIAHQLLVGTTPSKEDAVSAAWGAISRGGRSSDREVADAWDNRTDNSRQFVRWLLRPQAHERPSAAAALQHPWIQNCFSLDLDHWHPNAEGLPDLKGRMTCYMLSVLMLPAVMQYRDCFQLRSSFANHDIDRDGFITSVVAHRILKERGIKPTDAAAALDAVDVKRVGVLNLCMLFAANNIAQTCASKGEDTRRAPSDLSQKMTVAFFRVFGDAQRLVTSMANVRAKQSSVVVREVEMHASVRYDEVFSCLPDEDVFDSTTLSACIFEAMGRGTPLASGDAADDREDSETSWGDALGFERVQDLMKNVFQTCGLSGAALGHCNTHCEVVSMQTAFTAPSGSKGGEDKGYRRMGHLGGQ